MKSSSALLFFITSLYSISCGLSAAAVVNNSEVLLNNSEKNVSTFERNNTTTPPQTSSETELNNVTARVDQLIVPKAAIANVSDILLSHSEIAAPITSPYTNEVSTTTAYTAEENKTIVDGNNIVVPKDAINTTLELTTVTEQTSSTPITISNVTVEEAIVVPKISISNGTASNGTNNLLTSATEEPNQGLGPISVHKRSVNSCDEIDASAFYEKYDKWTGPGAITSQEIRELKKKGLWIDQMQNTNAYGLKKRRRRKKREAAFAEGESKEDENYEIKLRHSMTSQESSSREMNATDTSSMTNNDTDITTVENVENVDKEHLRDDVGDDDDSVCAVNKDDEEATKVVTIFWRSVFCVIFVIIIVYPIYSYTKIYCQKRRKDSTSISNNRFIGSDSEISNTTNDCSTPTTPTPTPTTK